MTGVYVHLYDPSSRSSTKPFKTPFSSTSVEWPGMSSTCTKSPPIDLVCPSQSYACTVNVAFWPTLANFKPSPSAVHAAGLVSAPEIEP